MPRPLRSLRMPLATILLVATFLTPLLAASPTLAAEGSSPELAEKNKGFGHRLLFYIPNRIFDVFDIFRARIRLGPGFAVDGRVTRYGNVYAGVYTSIWGGLPGPRLEPRIPWPAGVESRRGVELGLEEEPTETSPGYGYGEIGGGLQLAIVGLDLGADPVEFVDLLAGIFFLDLTKDDY